MVIYAAVVLAVAVVLARLAPQHETLLLLALVPILAAHRTDPNAYLYEDAAPRKAALADTERLPAVVLTKAGSEVAPDLVVQVIFGEWTSDGILRHPAYLGQREDKAATDVVRELPS